MSRARLELWEPRDGNLPVATRPSFTYRRCSTRVKAGSASDVGDTYYLGVGSLLDCTTGRPVGSSLSVKRPHQCLGRPALANLSSPVSDGL